jgi:hypothetical protein
MTRSCVEYIERMCADWDFSLRAEEGKGEGVTSRWERGVEKVRAERGVRAEGVSMVERGVSRCDIHVVIVVKVPGGRLIDQSIAMTTELRFGICSD